MDSLVVERHVAAIIERANETAAYWPELVGREYRKFVLAHVAEADEIRKQVLRELDLSP